MPDPATLSGPDAGLVLMLAAAVLAALVLLLAAGLLAASGKDERRLRKRKEMLGLTPKGEAGMLAGLFGSTLAGGRNDPAANRQRRIQEKLQELEQSKQKRSARRNQIKAELTQAAVNVPPSTFLTVCAALAVGAGGLLALSGMNIAIAGLGGVAIGFGLPKLVLRMKGARRRKAFTAEFANAVDVLVRGIRSGLPIGECLAIIGRELPDPVGQEFRMLVEGQKLGMALDDLMKRGLERMPTNEYRFFAIVLQIQQQTGGNLAETLDGLSSVLRERKKLRDKVRALSSEARASAGIIGSLPFLVACFVYLLNPDYISLLFTDRLGNFMLAGGLVWMGLGVAVMAKMVNFKI